MLIAALCKVMFLTHVDIMNMYFMKLHTESKVVNTSNVYKSENVTAVDAYEEV